MLHCHEVRPYGAYDETKVFDIISLAAHERQVRRKKLTLQHGDDVMVDLPHTVDLSERDGLILEDGRVAQVFATDEPLMMAVPDPTRNIISVAQLSWHVGNRHLPCQIEDDRLLLERDPVIRRMLEGLGALVSDVVEPFYPMRGAYHGHGQDHEHSHNQSHGHHHE